jgi:hypothetical protein
MSTMRTRMKSTLNLSLHPNLTDFTSCAILFLILLFYVSHSFAIDESHASANDKTPIRYLYCDADGNKCNVMARFRDLATCERIKELDSAYCDRLSKPGTIVCDTQRKSVISASCCTR